MNQANSPVEPNDNSDEWKSVSPKEFLAIILHELRSPTMIIKGYVEIISTEDGKEYLPEAIEAISSSIQKMERIYQDMATYTRELSQKS